MLCSRRLCFFFSLVDSFVDESVSPCVATSSCRPAGRDDLGSSAFKRHSYNITDTRATFDSPCGPDRLIFFSFSFVAGWLWRKKKRIQTIIIYHTRPNWGGGRESWVESVCRWRRCGSFILILCHLRPQKKEKIHTNPTVCFAFIFASKSRLLTLIRVSQHVRVE